MSWEASLPGVDARRALLARLILDHRLSAQDPLALAADGESDVAELVLAEHGVALTEVTGLLTA
jgi:acyl-CoA dehydrogenase